MLIGKKDVLCLYKGLGLLLFIFKTFLVVHAQQPNIEFKPFGPLSDITSSKASVIVEDSVGYLWIGTEEGLYRFDGQTIYPYTMDAKNPRSLPSNGVINLVIDRDNNLWVGTKTGICKYNREYNDFSGVPDTSKINGFNNCFIKTFTFDKTGKLFVAYNQVVYKYVQSESRFVKVVKIDRGDISAMIFDDQNNLWIGNLNNGGLFCYDFRKKQLIPFLNDPSNPQSISINEVKTLAISGHTLWIGTIGKGIDTYNFIDKKFKHYQFPGKLDNYINSIFISRDDKAWVCTLSNFKLYNSQGDYFYNYYHDVNNPYSVGRSLQGVYEDREGNLWNIHAFGGIRLARRYAPFRQNGVQTDPLINSSEKEVTAIAFDGLGQRWTFNPSLGLNITNDKTGRSTYLKYNKNNPRSIADGVVFTIFRDSNNQIWLGSYIGGLKKYNPQSGDFDTWYHNPKDTLSIAGNDIRSIDEDSNGNLWLATHRQGIDQFDRQKNRFIHYNSKNNKLCDQYTNQVFVDSKDNVWVATAVGLGFLPKGQKLFKNYFHSKNDPHSISDNEIQVVYEDRKHTIWVGTNDGLNKFDSRTGHFTLYAAGLKKTRISSILSDNNNNIWVATSTSISMLDIVTSRFINYNQDYGVHSKEFFDRACARDSSGNLYFGGSAGYDFFHPDSIKRADNNLKVILTDFKLFNQSISCRTDSQIINKHISYAKQVFLEYFQNSIAFHYQAISLTDGHTIEYSYKLDGFDKDWVYAGKERIANYTNLNPGNYTFRVKAKFENGQWSDNETTIGVKVHPAWWMTIGFKIIVILLVICFIYIYVFLRTKRLHSQRERLTQLVAERTHEIENKNELLRLQAESLAGKNELLNNLNATKDRLFSIISHDLRGPFNVILGFQNILVNEYPQCSEEERIDMVRKTYSTSRKVFNLVENLLSWARIQTSSIRYDPVALDVARTIVEKMDLYRDIAEAKGIQFSTRLEEGLVAWADSNILEAVLRNLVHNAIKFTPHGGLIEIKAFGKDHSIVISIIDSGVGMTPQQVESLFIPEKAVSFNGTGGEKGSGLGLLLCKDFVEMNGGKISVSSSWGKGSCFSFTMPVFNKQLTVYNRQQSAGNEANEIVKE
ncbi:MAG: two-component regulator propeller domain-containing protein [Candidatus Saccharibacteria bacterium]